VDSSTAPQRAALLRSSLDLCKSSKPHPSGSLPSLLHYLLKIPFPGYRAMRSVLRGSRSPRQRLRMEQHQRTTHTKVTRRGMQKAVLRPGSKLLGRSGALLPQQQPRRSSNRAPLRPRIPVLAQPVPPLQPRPQALPTLPPRAPLLRSTNRQLPPHRPCPTAAPLSPADEPRGQRAACPAGAALLYGARLQLHAEAMQTLSQP